MFPQDKVYLQTDKPYYLSGERIWFHAYIVNAASHILDFTPNSVFVELFDLQDSVVCRVKTNFDNDLFSGYITIPENVIEGDYILRAYTNAMRNLDEDYFFMKSIRIANPRVPAVRNKDNSIQNKKKNKGKLPVPEDDFDVTFYPEGGSALYGCTGRIAFKSMQSSGREIDVTGVIYDRQGNEITRFKTDVRGMGLFVLMPQRGETYYAVCTDNKGQTKRFELPAAKGEGYALSATWSKDRLIVKALHPEAQSDTLCLLVHTRGVVQDARILDDINKPVVFERSSFSSGVSNLLLLTKERLPLSERLVFVYNDDQAKVESASDSAITQTRSPVNYSASFTGQSGEPLSGTVSVSVTDDYAVAADTSCTILTSLLLTSDLRGNISNPAFYFQKTPRSEWAAELLMLTQGWRRYNTERIVRNNFIYPDSLLEKGFEISGIVKSKGTFSSKPEENASVSLMSLDGAYFGNTVTDRNGRFYLPDGNAPDSTRFILQTTPTLSNKANQEIEQKIANSKILSLRMMTPPKDRNLELTIDNPSYPPRTISAFPLIAPVQEAFLNYVEQEGRRIRTVQLGEVTVTAQMKPQRISSYYAHPDRSITEEELDRFPASSLRALLMRLPGVRISEGSATNEKIKAKGSSFVKPIGITIYITKFGQNCPVRDFLVDDFPVDNIDWVDVSDIAQIDLLTSPTNLAAFGVMSGCGAIAIYTKFGRGGVPKKNLNIGSIVLLGFQKPAEFYAPKYDSPEQDNTSSDLRTTIHWQPNLTTDERGTVSFNFYTADTPSVYSIVIEGVASDGKIIYKRDKIVVERKNE